VSNGEGIADIHLYCERAATRGTNGGCDLVELGACATGYRNVRTGLSVRQRDRAPQSAPAPGDERNLATQLRHSGSFTALAR